LPERRITAETRSRGPGDDGALLLLDLDVDGLCIGLSRACTLILAEQLFYILKRFGAR